MFITLSIKKMEEERRGEESRQILQEHRVVNKRRAREQERERERERERESKYRMQVCKPTGYLVTL